jgi:hypothetical protein
VRFELLYHAPLCALRAGERRIVAPDSLAWDARQMLGVVEQGHGVEGCSDRQDLALCRYELCERRAFAVTEVQRMIGCDLLRVPTTPLSRAAQEYAESKGGT